MFESNLQKKNDEEAFKFILTMLCPYTETRLQRPKHVFVFKSINKNIELQCILQNYVNL